MNECSDTVVFPFDKSGQCIAKKLSSSLSLKYTESSTSSYKGGELLLNSFDFEKPKRIIIILASNLEDSNIVCDCSIWLAIHIPCYKYIKKISKLTFLVIIMTSSHISSNIHRFSHLLFDQIIAVGIILFLDAVLYTNELYKNLSINYPELSICKISQIDIIEKHPELFVSASAIVLLNCDNRSLLKRYDVVISLSRISASSGKRFLLPDDLLPRTCKDETILVIISEFLTLEFYDFLSHLTSRSINSNFEILLLCEVNEHDFQNLIQLESVKKVYVLTLISKETCFEKLKPVEVLSNISDLLKHHLFC